MTDLADFRRVNVNVNDLCTLSKCLDIASYAVIKSSAQSNEQICLLEAGNSRHGAVHAGHTQMLGVRVGIGTACHQGGCHRGTDELGQLVKLLVSTSADYSTAYIENRLL